MFSTTAEQKMTISKDKMNPDQAGQSAPGLADRDLQPASEQINQLGCLSGVQASNKLSRFPA